MKLFAFFTLIFLASCSSTSTNENKKIDQKLIDDEYAYIKNSDFIPPKEIKYEEYQDQFTADLNEPDSLRKESIARLPPKKLEQVSLGPDPISKGIGLCYQNRFDEAFKLFDAIYFQYKSHPSYWNQVGSCYFLQRNYRKALLFYNKARDVNGSYAPAINNIGVIYLKQGKEQKALLAFKKAIEINSFSATPIFNLAQLYLKYGLADDAQKMFMGLLKQKSGDQDVLAGLGNVYLLKGDMKNSIAYYSQIDSTSGVHPHVGLNYAVALKLAGQVPQAQAVYKKVDANELGNLRTYYQRVATFIGM